MSSSRSLEPSLFPLRIGATFPLCVNGADISFSCQSECGDTYYCKSDKDGRLIRATEWFFTNLAKHLNVATADCAIMLQEKSGETFFGSRDLISSASAFDTELYLNTKQVNELGQHVGWLQQYLSRLYAMDLFFSNIDRNKRNFLLQRDGLSRRLCAIDFASGRLGDLHGKNFPVADAATVRVGRILRRHHGFSKMAAFEMIDWIRTVSAETIDATLGRMPDDWMSAEQREGICGLWSSKRIGERLEALRAGIADESLL